MPLDVLLISDHKVVRDGIKAILSRSSEFHVVAEAANGPAAFESVQRLRPHIVLLDIDIPGLNAAETTRQILGFHGARKIAILSISDDDTLAIGALRAGARGFLVKGDSDVDLVEILRLVADGGLYVSPQVSTRFQARIPKAALQALQNLLALQNRLMLRRRSPRGLRVLRRVAGPVRQAVRRKR
jgi:two-component system nitrate/nitrite response regulator NarL